MSREPAVSHDYIRDGAEIYRRSFAIIRSEADLDGLEPVLERTVVRMIHACGMVDLTSDVIASPGFAPAAEAALQAGAPILCDTNMVASALAAEIGNTRTAAAVELWRPHLEGAVVAIGNAPTALFHLLDMVASGGPRPAAVIGVPVGFVGAAESKQALTADPGGLEHLVVRGRRGGSAIAVAAVNALASRVE